MEKRIQKDSWLRKIRTLAVVGVMTIAGAGSAWGQTAITLRNQTNIPERVDTVYIPDGASRELYVPELRNNDGRAKYNKNGVPQGNVNYKWYVRWYRIKDGQPVTIDNKFKKADVDLRNTEIIEGGTATAALHKGALHETSDGMSLFWYRGFFLEGTNDADSYESTATGASTVLYRRNASDTEDIVFCDVSMNTDFNGTEGQTTLTEPTLSKRYKFVIRPAKEIADKIQKANGAGIEHYEISAPSTAQGINIQMKTFPSNYCWYYGGSILSGDHYVYDGGKIGELASDKQVIGLGSVPTQTTVNVYAVASNGQKSPLLATFTIIPQDNAEFMLEEKVKTSEDPRRNPAARPDLYEDIGFTDFDMGAAIELSEEPLSSSNNLCATPMSSESTTYAFLNPDITMYTEHDHAALQNQYGLYRSANVPNISNGSEYFWFFALRKNPHAHAVYDRTYANTDGKKCGYFFYTDASNEPGRWVKLELDNVICQYTELTVTAWVNDMTTWNETNEGKPLPPNININFIGKKGDEEIVLHRFTSGDALTDYSETYDGKEANKNVGEWQQLCYTFSISSDQTGYEKYYLEVQNNTAHTYGADYAIDDVRVYKSKPNIEVYRENVCESSSLKISTDYATILRNMGWTKNEPVATDDEFDFDDLDNLNFRKYRYGLMGDKHQYINSTVGNVYFAFYDDNSGEWQTVNEAVADYSKNAAHSLRVAVSTVQSQDASGYTNGWEFYTNSETEALKFEQKMNLRAVDDYNKDIEDWQNKEGKNKHPGKIETSNIGTPGETDFKEEEYQKALIELFGKRLDIPRLRCPWYDASNEYLYLAIIDVNNTSLRYQGEVLDDKGTEATGEYQVVTFSAEAVAKVESTGGTYQVNPKDPCTLMSPFVVYPSTTVLIDAVSPGVPEYAVCMGTVHQIQAYLNFFDNGSPVSEDLVKNYDYIFDWYLGSEEEYNKETVDGLSIKDVLEKYRDEHKFTLAPITKEEVEEWKSTEKNKAEFLLRLMNENKLILGTPANEPFDMPLNTEWMMSMPYLTDIEIEQEKITYTFCDEETPVNLKTIETPIPEMYHGFVNVSYPEGTEIALRLGQPNMNATSLDLPIYKVEGMAPTADHLGLGGTSVDIYLDDLTVSDPVGTATSLNIAKPISSDGKLSADGKLIFSLKTTAKQYMKEGQTYTLLIPFVQFNGTEQLNSECDGVLKLPVKVVPEYLTWKGAADDNWYDDEKWNQSTNRELHLGEPVAQDANGSDIVTNAFSPLYFSNITILGDTLSAANRELQLDNTITKDDNQEGTLSITDSIKYDLAVADKDGKITPYYIYNVDEIYFKPGATLLNQHRLTYDKAWVEFEMTPGEDYWMASPLKEVYAGDMYAPTVGGQQNTEAFTDITYGSGNSRWNPAFYQKAWNKDIQYAASDANKDGVPDDSEITSVEVVPSNWSIEYNDATVSYAIGKGFYSRVEMTGATDNTVKVRLPKADNDYKYEYSPTTRVLHDVTDKTEQPNLADLDADGSMSLDLSTVDNDGNHFLVGNPYMAYLNMSEFLKANSSVLAEKYWTIDNEKVIVGTPDVVGTTGEWPNEQKIGYVAPMQAFFVESKDYNPGSGTTKADGEVTEAKKVTFNASMTVAAATAKGQETKSFSAVNPVLTLTATSKQGQSRAAVVQKSDASNQYEADKDAVALLDSEIDAPMAYTVAGSYAAAVNAIHDYKNVPLGVYAKDGEEVELSIEGASQLVSPLYLYDAVTRSTTPIDGDSFTLNLTGSSHGRYFLTTDEGIKAEGDIRIYSPADGQLIIASTPSDRLKQVQVYDLNGRMVESRQNVGTATCQLYVPGGIYIVRVQSEQGEAQAKLKIK